MFVECFVFWLFIEVLRDWCWVLSNRCTTSRPSCVRKQKILCKLAPAHAENELPWKLHIQYFTFDRQTLKIFFKKYPGMKFLSVYPGYFLAVLSRFFTWQRCQGFDLYTSVRLKVNSIYLISQWYHFNITLSFFSTQYQKYTQLRLIHSTSTIKTNKI